MVATASQGPGSGCFRLKINGLKTRESYFHGLVLVIHE